MTSKWAMAISIVIAALMILPQALAIDTGLGGPAGSTYTKFSSTAGNSINVQNSLSANGLASFGAISGDGDVEQYFEWISTDGHAKAAAYAYMADSDSYTYDFTGSRGRSFATANLKFTATEAENFLLGGFAYNPRDYAGTFVSGNEADYINYKNSLYASTSKVTATQNFYGTGFEDLEAFTWAERGYIGDEYKVADDVNPFVTAEWHPEPGYWDATVGSPSALASEQYMWLDDGSILNPRKPYTASASLYSNAATSSQSVTLNGENGEKADVEFYSWAQRGDWTADTPSGYEAQTYMGAYGVTDLLNNVVYSASSKATYALASASQSVNVKRADRIYKNAEGDNYDYDLDASEGTGVDRYTVDGLDSGIYSSMSGTDSATTKAGSSSVTQQLTTVSGAHIDKYIEANNNNDLLGYHVEDLTSIFGNVANVPQKASTLSGKSTATATMTSSSISGNWKASIAKDTSDAGYSFERTGFADNGGTSIKHVLKSTHNAAIPSYVFREFDKANAFGTWT
ncbi:MAG: hypothetical protein ACYDHX_07120 [Methanothrix sp.]